MPYRRTVYETKGPDGLYCRSQLSLICSSFCTKNILLNYKFYVFARFACEHNQFLIDCVYICNVTQNYYYMYWQAEVLPLYEIFHAKISMNISSSDLQNNTFSHLPHVVTRNADCSGIILFEIFGSEDCAK